MSRIRLCLIMVLLPLLLLSACARAAQMEKPVEVEAVPAAPTMAARAPALDAYSGEKLAVVSAGQALASTEERMIIRTGNLVLVVKDTEAAVETIKGIVAADGGYVVSSNVWRDNELFRGRMTVRVPADRFDATMGAIKGVAVKVDREETTGQDVTEEYADLDARLVNLEATEKELRELLTTVRERTGKAEDILAVYEKLTAIRGQIEQIKGRMQYLERLTAMATINIELRPDVLAEPVVQSGWQPSATVRDALRNLVRMLQFLVDAAIWIILYVVPVLLILALPLVVLILIIRRLRRRKAAA